MATVYTKTDNYGLNLYGDNDPADLRDGYNGSMRTIDTTLKTHLNRIESVEARETHEEAVMKALLGDNTVDKATAAKAKWDKSSKDAAAAASKADNNTAILTALGAGSTGSAATQKTKWDKAGVDATTAIGKTDSNTAILTALGADNTGNARAKQTKWDNAANKANALEPRVQALEQEGTQVQRNIVLLGDSWTVVHNNALYNRLKVDMPHATWHNYGINGAVLQKLPEMVNNAKKDTGMHADQVTDVIIVMGTNNVFWTNLDGYPDITEDSAYTAFKSVRDYFINANIIFVPNNSKTLNNGRNSLYAKMVDGAHRAGVTTHEESLILLCGHREWFNGDDQEGVQHLSDTGYQRFADHIANLLQGGAMVQEGRIGAVDGQNFSYSNPSDKSGIDDNTLQIYAVNGGLFPVGWLQNPKASFIYHSDQTVTVEISGTVKFWDASNAGYCYIGCPNWWKDIAPNTLPYVFTHGESDLYYQPKSLTGLSNDYMLKVESKEGGKFCTRSFYFCVDMLLATHANKSMRLLVPNVQTEIMGVSR